MNIICDYYLPGTLELKNRREKTDEISPFEVAMAFGHGLRKVPPKPGFIERTAAMGFPAPEAFAWAAGLAELVGGILLAIGLFTRPSAFFIVVTMLVAAFLRHGADPFSEKELALLYGFAAAYFMVRGSGRYGLDAWLFTGRT